MMVRGDPSACTFNEISGALCYYTEEDVVKV
jgi:hypothetical protein